MKKRAGRLVLDPMCVFFFPCWYAVPTTGFTREVHIEFGDEVVSRLKLSPDGTQPTNDPEGLRTFVFTFNLHGGIDCRFLGGLNGARPFSWSLSHSLWWSLTSTWELVSAKKRDDGRAQLKLRPVCSKFRYPIDLCARGAKRH